VNKLRLAFALIAATAFSAQAAEPRQPLYYQDPSGQSEFSPTPKKDVQGRDFVPVYDDPDTPAPAAVPKADRGKPLYYRNSMGLPDTSPVPKKDSMGMDYVPVYADDLAGAPGSVAISPERVQMLGVRTETARLRAMTRSIRAVATVAVDERRVAVVAPRFEGWVETLNVSATGDAVEHGQTLFSYYSPDLALAEREYVLAQQASGELAQSALARLENLNIPADEIARLRKTGKPSRTASIGAPLTGVVMEKTAIQGMRFAAGDTLYRIADLSHVWVLADVFEQDIADIHPGQTARIAVAAYPDASFSGQVTFIYPTVNPTTRTARLRIEVANAAMLLKPDMYATVEIAAPVGAAEVLAVPDSAVLDSGTRQVVLVERSAGHFEPHAVTIGRHADGYAEIRSGIASGDKVVVGANFLIDAESNLRTALQGFTAPVEAKP
jgi:Cu(I)/Ag(I) efflux system membrane fusion protein